MATFLNILREYRFYYSIIDQRLKKGMVKEFQSARTSAKRWPLQIEIL